MAEYVRLREGLVALKPRALSHPEAASLPLAGLTSLQALVGKADLRKRWVEGTSERSQPKVLVLGASGGTGALGVQIAAFQGASVAATASKRNADMVLGLGASKVIDYRTQDFGE